MAGYVIYYGNFSGNYPNSIDVGSQTKAVVGGLAPRETYYFVVRAYRADRALARLPTSFR